MDFLNVSVFILTVSVLVLGQDNDLLDNLASKYATANNDFSNYKPNSEYFPLTKSRDENVKIQRFNYATINTEEFSDNITKHLQTWRGFDDVYETIELQLLNKFIDMFTSLPSELQQSVLQFTLSPTDLQQLPLGLQYLLPSQYLRVSGSILAKIVSSYPGNTALLYKMAMILRDESVTAQEEFINKINLPDQFREDLGYIIGNRWGLRPGPDNSDLFSMPTLLHLPVDIIMNISNETFDALKLKEKLSDMSNWNLASSQSKVAWYSKFIEQRGWDEVASTPHHLMNHGHLLAGAPLDKLKKLKGKGLETSMLVNILDRTDMNPLRVQLVWEALSSFDKETSFVSQAHKLDISQIIEHYESIGHAKFKHKTKLEENWMSGANIDVPWVNMVRLAYLYMEDEEFASWSAKELTALGKFVFILSPAELDLIPSSIFNSTILPRILSPRLSLSQLTSIYKKTSLSTSMNPILLSALPSSQILSATPPFIWSQDKVSLLIASEKFSPGQMHALHEIVKVGHWNTGNLSTILATHPQCLADVSPKEFRANLDQVVAAVYSTGTELFHTVAMRLRQLPRHLLMTWLEEVHSRPGSQKAEEYWNSDVLLDKITPTAVSDDLVTNPFPTHPMAAQFRMFTSSNKSLLSSLALVGMSCHCIGLVETQDTLEVLALYRYQMESENLVTAMPSSARKCWAKKVRQFLKLKSILFNVTVSNEPELLSLLTTSDIKTIGGEILITWGGPALSSITHPEVMREVLVTVGQTPPLLFLRNGVSYSCLKIMATTLLDTMIKEEGGVNLRVLTQLHNLVPYTDQRVLEANSTDIKLYISSVLRLEDKAVCLKKRERELLRELVLKGYGAPSNWSSLELVELGDLLVVMARSDLSKVKPNSLRLATPQLSSMTLFSTLLSEVRGHSSPVLYHEACSNWLGGQEGWSSQESIDMTSEWTVLANFIVLGSYLQVEVLKNSASIPQPRFNDNFGRRKRQASAINYKGIYTLVMNDMKEKFDAKKLSDVQKLEATKIIAETQQMLGDHSFAVLGLDREGKSQTEVLAVLAEYKDAGNMTEKQTMEVQQLAVDTQVRMIQELVAVLNLTATELGLSTEDFSSVMSRETFVLTPTDIDTTVASNEVLVTELMVDISATSKPADIAEADVIEGATETSTPLSEGATKISATLSENATEFPTASTSTLSTSSTTSANVIASSTSDPLTEVLREEIDLTEALTELNNDDVNVFTSFEPDISHFKALPSLDLISLSCDVILGAGSASSSISPMLLSKMARKEFENCLETLGHISWPDSKRLAVWEIIKDKVEILQNVNMLPIKRGLMIQLHNLLPSVATQDPNLLDMDRRNIDGISYLGKFLQSTDPNILKLVQVYISKNLITPTNPLTSTEAAALGQLLCGLEEDQWRNLISPNVFASILTEHLSRLDCHVTLPISQFFSSRLITLYGPVSTWTTADLLSIGMLASTLAPEELSQLKPHVMEGLTGLAVKYLTSQQLGSLSYSQMSQLSPHAASFISREQVVPLTSVSKRRGIRAAVGEDERLTKVVGEMEDDSSVLEEGRDGKVEIESDGDLPSTTEKGVDIDVTEDVDNMVEEGGSSNSETVIDEKSDNVTGGASARLPSYSVVLIPLMLVKMLSFMF